MSRTEIIEAGNTIQSECHGASRRAGWWDGVDLTDKNADKPAARSAANGKAY